MDGSISQYSVCNSSHDLRMLCCTLSIVAIITLKCVDYRQVIYGSGKSEAVYLLENAVLDNLGCKMHMKEFNFKNRV